MTLEEELTRTEEELEAELCRRDFRYFARRAWSIVDPAPLVWNWHLDAYCLHLQAVAEGRIRKLLVNVPPGHAKSLFFSVLYPAWRWTREPWWRLLSGSYVMELAKRNGTSKVRTLVKDPWYQRHFCYDPRSPSESWGLVADTEGYFSNDCMGFIQAVGVDGQGTGYRGDGQNLDDILKALDAYSKSERDKANRWVAETMSSRFNDQAAAERVVVAQRLHEDDPYGELLRTGAYVHLRLPSRYEPPSECPERACVTCHQHGGVTPIGWKDPRTVPGELLFPAKFPEHVLAEAESPAGMGLLAFAGQHQQRPVPASGGIFQRAWLGRRWHRPGSAPVAITSPVAGHVRRPYSPDEVRPRERFIITDASFKGGAENDKVVIGVFDVYEADLYLLDFVWGNMDVIDTERHLKALREKWSRGKAKVGRVCIEDKANGPAILTRLRSQVPGLVAIDPQGSKEARFYAGAPYAHAGNLWLPEEHPQTELGVEEMVAVPKGRWDDFADVVTYGLLLGLASSSVGKLEDLVKW